MSSPDSGPLPLEHFRDEQLARIIAVRTKAQQYGNTWAVGECAKLSQYMQSGQNGFEIGFVSQTLDYLELLVDFGGDRSK
jgi:hypothetical protein